MLVPREPGVAYLPTDFRAAPPFSTPDPVPKASFRAPHFTPRPVALRPLKDTLPVASPVLATAVLADSPAALISCPAPSWLAAATGKIKQIDRKMFLAARMVLLYRKVIGLSRGRRSSLQLRLLLNDNSEAEGASR